MFLSLLTSNFFCSQSILPSEWCFIFPGAGGHPILSPSATLCHIPKCYLVPSWNAFSCSSCMFILENLAISSKFIFILSSKCPYIFIFIVMWQPVLSLLLDYKLFEGLNHITYLFFLKQPLGCFYIWKGEALKFLKIEFCKHFITTRED